MDCHKTGSSSGSRLVTAVRKVPVMNLLYLVCQTRLSLWTRSFKMHMVLNITISTTGTVLSAPLSLNTSLSLPFLSSRLAFSLSLPSSAQKRQSVYVLLCSRDTLGPDESEQEVVIITYGPGFDPTGAMMIFIKSICSRGGPSTSQP